MNEAYFLVAALLYFVAFLVTAITSGVLLFYRGRESSVLRWIEIGFQVGVIVCIFTFLSIVFVG